MIKLKPYVAQRSALVPQHTQDLGCYPIVPIPKISQDSLSLRFGNAGPAEKEPKPTEFYANHLDTVLAGLPVHLRAALDGRMSVTIAETMAAAINLKMADDGRSLHRELSPAMMQFADYLRDSFPPEVLQIVRAVIEDPKALDVLATGQGALELTELSEDETEEGLERTDSIGLDLEPVNSAASLEAPSETTTALMMLLRQLASLDISTAERMALLRALSDPDDDSPLKGFADLADAGDADSISGAEAIGNLVGVQMGTEEYDLFLSTNHGQAEWTDIEPTLFAILALILINRFELHYQKQIIDAYDRDLRVHNVHRAIKAKLDQASAGEFQRLEQAKEELSILDKSAAKMGKILDLETAVRDCVTHLVFNTNLFDPDDTTLIPLMYPTLIKAVAKKLDLPIPEIPKSLSAGRTTPEIE